MTARRPRLLSEWALLPLWLGLSVMLFFSDTRPAFRAGAVLDVAITLVSQDSVDLACGSDSPIAGFWCGLSASGKPLAHRGDALVPAVTTDRRLLLVAGLFQRQSVAERVAVEVNRVPRAKQRRFVAHCRVRVLEKTRLPLRWLAKDGLGPATEAWLVQPGTCSVTDG